MSNTNSPRRTTLRFSPRAAALAILCLMGCGGEPASVPCCNGQTSQAMQPECDPNQPTSPACNGDPGEWVSILNVKVSNADESPWKFTLGISVMDPGKRTVFANTIPLNATILAPGEVRNFSGVMMGDPGQLFVLGGVAYDQSTPASWANFERDIAIAKPSYTCELVYRFEGEGRMSGSCY